jgi:hypothetical protein
MSKFKNVSLAVFAFLLVASLVYKIFKRSLTDHLLKTDAQHIKAVIIDERNYAPNDPVKPEFSYSYMFIINGKAYTNNAHDASLKIGDSIEVIYVKNWPSLNRALHLEK